MHKIIRVCRACFSLLRQAVIIVPVIFCGQGAFSAPTQVTLVGELQALSISDRNDVWSKGTIVVGGVSVIVPRNLLVQLPVKRMTLQELYVLAPTKCKSMGQAGLARSDSCLPIPRGAIATVRANRVDSGEVIAGEILITKTSETLMGVVTYINHEHGYFRVNGITNEDQGGVMVRINDPTARHSIQSGPGCAPGNVQAANCSPDQRFAVDPDNYSAAFVTGVPLCIPSTQAGGKRTSGSSISGDGDPYCPLQNRTKDPVVEPIPTETSHLFAPLVLGESLEALGNFEVIDNVKFLSASKVRLHARIMTNPGNPDYMSLDIAEWDAPGFTAQRVRLRLIGYTSTPDSQLDVYGLHYDPLQNKPHEILLASTAGNPLTVNRGLPPFGGSIFKINFDVDFVKGPLPKGSPCFNLANAGFDESTGGCVSGFTVDTGSNFAVLSPIARDILARSRNKTFFDTRSSIDLSGNVAPNGVFKMPVTVAYPTPAEFNVAGLAQPYLFTGEPWLLDRRLGPDGCKGPCESSPQPLAPWPWDGGLDPRLQSAAGVGVPATGAQKVLAYLTKNASGVFGFNGAQLSLPKAPSSPERISPVPANPMRQCRLVLPVRKSL